MRQLRKCGHDVAGRGQLGAPPGFPEGEDSVFCVLWENEWDHSLLSSKYLLPCIWGVGKDENKPQVGLSLTFACGYFTSARFPLSHVLWVCVFTVSGGRLLNPIHEAPD